LKIIKNNKVLHHFNKTKLKYIKLTMEDIFLKFMNNVSYIVQSQYVELYNTHLQDTVNLFNIVPQINVNRFDIINKHLCKGDDVQLMSYFDHIKKYINHNYHCILHCLYELTSFVIENIDNVKLNFASYYTFINELNQQITYIVNLPITKKKFISLFNHSCFVSENMFYIYYNDTFSRNSVFI
jgi:hypothetical protein